MKMILACFCQFGYKDTHSREIDCTFHFFIYYFILKKYFIAEHLTFLKELCEYINNTRGFLLILRRYNVQYLNFQIEVRILKPVMICNQNRTN